MTSKAQKLTEEQSLPLWECGLKSVKLYPNSARAPVTPLVGVWIEIELKYNTSNAKTSLPLWECGLKSEEEENEDVQNPVTPMWECGLK